MSNEAQSQNDKYSLCFWFWILFVLWVLTFWFGFKNLFIDPFDIFPGLGVNANDIADFHENRH